MARVRRFLVRALIVVLAGSSLGMVLALRWVLHLAELLDRAEEERATGGWGGGPPVIPWEEWREHVRIEATGY